MQYDVPFLSQYVDLGDHEWRARGCGIVSLKMVMDFLHRQDPANRTVPLDELLRAGLASGAYLEGIGWTHRGLVALAVQYGYGGFNADWNAKSPTPKTSDDAWDLMLGELEHGPVLASVYSRFDPSSRDGHMIVITGWDGELLSFNDPEAMTEREGKRLLAAQAFQHASKQRYIVIRPASELKPRE